MKDQKRIRPNSDTDRKAASELENLVADRFGTERISLRDKVVSGSADVSHREFFIKCNRRKEISLYRWYETAMEECPEDKVPMIVAKAPYKIPLVVMNLEDFVSIYQSSDEDLLTEISELKEQLKESKMRVKELKDMKTMETVEERRERISTYPYRRFSKSSS